MKKPVTLTQELFDSKLSKKINDNLPGFMKKKSEKDAALYLEELRSLNSLPIQCVTSYRQGFSAALEYIRSRINKDFVEEEKKEEDGECDLDLSPAMQAERRRLQEERSAYFIQREDSADVREMKAMMKSEGLTIDEMSCTGLY